MTKTSLQKGASVYKEKIPKMVIERKSTSSPLTSPNEFILFDLENGHHYTSTLSAVNAHGLTIHADIFFLAI
jgi:hypothetical protein